LQQLGRDGEGGHFRLGDQGGIVGPSGKGGHGERGGDQLLHRFSPMHGGFVGRADIVRCARRHRQ
jgi:hypothetical protein